MELTMQNIDLRNIDKSNWESYRFDQIAMKISETVDPNNTDLTIYVGLEHLDAESIHIKRFGTPADVSGGKLKCYPGDVIFGKRRAYQRKASIVTFEGICSAHAFVLRANPEVIDPRLFPFFLHSDLFMHCAVDISVGGLSPTINWVQLKEQEFLLPPKDQQAQLAELLWAMDEVIEKEMCLIKTLELSFESYRKNFIENGAQIHKNNTRKLRFGKIFKNWQTKKLSSFSTLIGGNAFKSDEFKEKGAYQVLRIGNLTDKGFDLKKSPVFMEEISKAEQKYLIPKGAVVISLTGTNGKRDYGFPTLMKEHKMHLLNQRLAMILVNEKVMLPEFLFLLAKMELFQGRFFLNATGTANQANVSMTDVAKIELPIPPINEQKLIIDKMDFIRLNIVNSKSKNESSKALQKSLINQIF
ncbi:MAG: restriction endonuclease subunit S [Bacteroidales bacterium]|nr:restriction endonuclease subunit S [Bacteroidales bacterium]